MCNLDFLDLDMIIKLNIALQVQHFFFILTQRVKCNLRHERDRWVYKWLYLAFFLDHTRVIQFSYQSQVCSSLIFTVASDFNINGQTQDLARSMKTPFISTSPQSTPESSHCRLSVSHTLMHRLSPNHVLNCSCMLWRYPFMCLTCAPSPHAPVFSGRCALCSTWYMFWRRTRAL